MGYASSLRSRVSVLFVVSALLVAGGPSPAFATQSLPSTGARAVPTFESIGLYWAPGSNPGSAGCQIQYKKETDTAWKAGLAMWYDSRNSECRGSLVHLAPGTSYDVQFGLPGQAMSRGLTIRTWSENFPIARTVYVSSGSQTLNITSGGTAGGYVLYTSAPGTQATIDVANAQAYNVNISAPYVIVRGLILKGAQWHGVNIVETANDVVIEDNDISGWGRPKGTTSSQGYPIGMDYDSGVYSGCQNQGSVRAVVQRNKIHDPRYGANSWTDGHPLGPQGITFYSCGGNSVFRYNEIYSTAGNTKGHYFNDGIGGGDNFSTIGFPSADADIYGNRIENSWDDCVEAEGGVRNVRIWGNYCNNTATGIATTAVSVGPVYIFRNVYNRSRMLEGSTLDQDQRNTFAKSGSQSTYGHGRRYLFHNTLLQATQTGLTYSLGAGSGLGEAGLSVTNTVTRNNILHIWKTWWTTYPSAGSGNDYGYDLYNGTTGGNTVTLGMPGVPIYATGHGWTSEAGGMYQLASSSPGFDRGARIPNFNDAYSGAAPDVGAHEAGAAAMVFGVRGGAAPGPVPSPAPSPSASPSPSPSPSPSASPSPAPTVSAAGTSIPPVTQIIDSSLSRWTLASGVVYKNGSLAGYSANVVLLYWSGSAIYQKNSAGGWWRWDGTDWVDSSDPTCARANPAISLLAESGGSVSPGATVSFSIVIKNNDSGGCSASAFNLGAAVPSGWSKSLGSPSMQLAPGASGSTALSVTSPSSASAGSYSVSVSATNGGAAAFSGGASASITLVLPVSAAGTTIPPAAQIVDSSGSRWTLSGGVVYVNGSPAGYSANVVTLYWSGSAIYQGNATGGWWRWDGSAWVASANPLPLGVTVSSSASTYSRNSTATLTASVTLGGKPASGIAVSFLVKRPDGATRTLTATSDSAGKAVASYRIRSSYPRGVYQVTATATSGSQSASGSVSFSVQ